MHMRMCPDCDAIDIVKIQTEGLPAYRCCNCDVSWEENSQYDKWAKMEYTQKVTGAGG